MQQIPVFARPTPKQRLDPGQKSFGKQCVRASEKQNEMRLFPKPSGRTNDADAKFASGECGSFCAAASLSYAQRRGEYGCTLTSKADLTQYANLFASCP